MAENDATADLRAADRHLQAVQVAGDVDALESMLDDRLIFTLGPYSQCYTKQEYVDSHRTRHQVITRLVEEDLKVVVEADAGVTWVLGLLEGEFAGEPFTLRLRYTRTWLHNGIHGWRVLAMHASPA